MMNRILIESAANGYIATEKGSREMHMVERDPYVFETFEALSKWLGEQLEKPQANQAGSK